jgi:hydrogenase maturation protease
MPSIRQENELPKSKCYEQNVMKKILIGGIGNVLLGDDGVGPYAAALLVAHYEFAEGVEVIDLGTPALDLIDQISGKDAVILMDSVEAEAAPGTVLRYRKAEIMLHSPGVRMDTHSPALVDALFAASLFAIAPTDVLLVGVQAESYDAGCKLSEPVKASLNEVCRSSTGAGKNRATPASGGQRNLQ